MRSPNSNFRLFDRGFKDTILLIPGWATDYRIFGPLDLDFNYLMPVKSSPFNFKKDLLVSLDNNRLDNISILGWSMGAFLASDFTFEYPDRLDAIYIVAARARYEKGALETIRAYLKRNRPAYLYRFYHECFSKNEKEALSWFKRVLLKSYLKQIDMDALFDGLDYLLHAQLKLQDLKRCKIKFIHGELDKVAPIEEALEVKRSLPQAEFAPIEGAGHMPFLSSSFKKIFYDK